MTADRRSLYSETILRKLARASFRNAESLHVSARLLADHGRGAHAVALAIIGVEEFAKALVYILAALRPDQRHLLDQSEIRGHNLKHRIVDLVEDAVINTSESETATMIRAERGYALTSSEYYVEVLAHLARRDLRALSQRTSRKEADRIEDGLASVFRRRILMGPAKKEAALYVDRDEKGCPLTPDRVENDATAEVQRLALWLDHFAALPDIAADDARWSDFVDRVRPRLQIEHP